MKYIVSRKDMLMLKDNSTIYFGSTPDYAGYVLALSLICSGDPVAEIIEALEQ